MAEEGGARRDDRGAVRGRRGAWVSVPGRSREVPGGIAGAGAAVRTGTASREDAPDGIRALCRRAAEAAWGREAEREDEGRDGVAPGGGSRILPVPRGAA